MKTSALAALILTLWPAQGFAETVTPKVPNIVWLTTEDNSACWYRLYNPDHGAPMPNIERLAKSGLVFNNAYSCAPVCSAARSTIISGCYGPRTGAHYHRRQQRVKLPDGLKPFPAYLREAGYYTTNNHKTDYNYALDMKAAWDNSSSKASYRKPRPRTAFLSRSELWHDSRRQAVRGPSSGPTDRTASRCQGLPLPPRYAHLPQEICAVPHPAHDNRRTDGPHDRCPRKGRPAR